MGDALRQGIGEDQQERAEAEQDREEVEVEQDGEAGRQQHRHERRRASKAHRTGRQGAPAGARDAGIDIPVEDVVVRAARRAHDDGAGGEQHQQAEVRQAVGGEADRPQAGPEQEPDSGRLVEPRQGHERAQRPRRNALERPRVRRRGPGFAARALDHGAGVSWRA